MVMRLRRLRLVPVFVLLFAGGATAAGVLLLHAPDFYERCAEAPGNDRLETSNDFWLVEFGPFMAKFLYGRDRWSFTCSQKQLNSFLEEDFVHFGDAGQFSKIGISSPRIEFNDGQIRLGFRYGQGQWS